MVDWILCYTGCSCTTGFVLASGSSLGLNIGLSRIASSGWPSPRDARRKFHSRETFVKSEKERIILAGDIVARPPLVIVAGPVLWRPRRGERPVKPWMKGSLEFRGTLPRGNILVGRPSSALLERSLAFTSTVDSLLPTSGPTASPDAEPLVGPLPPFPSALLTRSIASE